MITQIIDKLKRVKRMFQANAFVDISRDELLCREYIEYRLVDKSKRRKEDLVKTMAKGCNVLEELGVKYWLGRGTVLGFHRDNDFLPNDIDIDIDVYTDRDVYKIIHKMPFEVLFVTNCRGRYMQLAFWDSETKVIFDIWFYYDSGRKLYNRNYFGYFWLPFDQIDRLTTMKFEGRDYPAPAPEWYCQFWYGDNWRAPKKYATPDWTIDYRKDCKGFIYEGVKNITDLHYYKDKNNARS